MFLVLIGCIVVVCTSIIAGGLHRGGHVRFARAADTCDTRRFRYGRRKSDEKGFRSRRVTQKVVEVKKSSREIETKVAKFNPDKTEPDP